MPRTITIQNLLPLQVTISFNPKGVIEFITLEYALVDDTGQVVYRRTASITPKASDITVIEALIARAVATLKIQESI